MNLTTPLCSGTFVKGYPDPMPLEIFQRVPGFGPLHAHAILRSPAASLASLEHQVTDRDVLLHRAFECLVFEPESFDIEYAVPSATQPPQPRVLNQLPNTDAQGRHLLDEHQHRVLLACRDSLRACATVREDFLEITRDGNRNDIAYVWEEELVGGVATLKARPFSIDRRRRLILDLKLVGDGLGPQRGFIERGHYLQSWWYRRPVEAATGDDYGYVQLTVDTRWPHFVERCVLTDVVEQYAEDRAWAALRAYTECTFAGLWPLEGCGKPPPAWVQVGWEETPTERDTRAAPALVAPEKDSTIAREVVEFYLGPDEVPQPERDARAPVAGSRPYLNLLKPDLFSEARAHWDSLGHLTLALDELRRRRLKDKDLAEVAEIQARVDELHAAWFRWVEVNATPGTGGPPPEGDWPQTGVLGHQGYKVGTRGLEERHRRQILDAVFAGPLPYVNDREYMAEWGNPSSPDRLRKLAWSIASFANNALRKDTPAMARSVSEWCDDLDYLHRRYYVQHFHFDWPEVKGR